MTGMIRPAYSQARVLPAWGLRGGVGEAFEAVAGQRTLSFAGLLRQLRAEARLTQEELAETAGVSPRSINDLERGLHATAQGLRAATGRRTRP
jgi:DNA-binding XRE family transcriptional regulator